MTPLDDRRDGRAGGTSFRVSGEGPPVVLIHGVGLDLDMWSGVTPALEPDFRVVRYDMLGHGGSAAAPDAPGLADFVAQLDRLYGDLDLGRAAVVGFSMGALVAEGFAVAHPGKVARLALLGGVYDRSAAEREAVLARVREVERGGVAATVDAALERWFTPEFRAAHPKVADRVCARLVANDADAYLAAYRVFATADAELKDAVAAIACPTLVMTGEDDPGATPAMARALAARLSRARSMVLPGLRHLAPVEDPDAVAAPLRDFLAEGDGR